MIWPLRAWYGCAGSRQLVDDADEMGNLGDHATNGWGVFALDDLVEASEAEALDDELVLNRGADLRTEVLQLNFGGCVLGCHERAPGNLVGGGELRARPLPCRAGRRLRL